jgi:cytochrome P450
MGSALDSLSHLKEKIRETPFFTLIDTVRDPFDLLRRRQKRHGDLFTLNLLGLPPLNICSEAETIKQLVTGSYEQLERYSGSVDLFLGPRSLIHLNDDVHRARRKLMNPSFNIDSVRVYGATMLEITDRALSTLRPGQRLSMLPKMRDITLRVIMRCVFGVTEGPRFEELRRLVLEYLNMIFQPDLFGLGAILGQKEVQRRIDLAAQSARRISVDQPFSPSALPFKRIADRLGRIQAILDAEIERCITEGPKKRKDIAALLLQARFDDGQPMSRDEIIEQLLMLLIGGYETTSNALCWAVYCLLRHKDVLGRVRSEVETVMGGKPFDAARARDLSYLGAMIQESMRLYPIALAMPRRLKKPMHIAGRELPAGTILMASIYLAQRNPSLWKDPETFLPERMLERRPPPTQLFPFGAGMWRCLGAAFAEHEMRIVLARLATQFSLELGSSAIKPRQLGITISPSAGLPVVVTAVHGQTTAPTAQSS